MNDFVVNKLVILPFLNRICNALRIHNTSNEIFVHTATKLDFTDECSISCNVQHTLVVLHATLHIATFHAALHVAHIVYTRLPICNMESIHNGCTTHCIIQSVP